MLPLTTYAKPTPSNSKEPMSPCRSFTITSNLDTDTRTEIELLDQLFPLSNGKDGVVSWRDSSRSIFQPEVLDFLRFQVHPSLGRGRCGMPMDVFASGHVMDATTGPVFHLRGVIPCTAKVLKVEIKVQRLTGVNLASLLLHTGSYQIHRGVKGCSNQKGA